jgi:hypothetical protein
MELEQVSKEFQDRLAPRLDTYEQAIDDVQDSVE